MNNNLIFLLIVLYLIIPNKIYGQLDTTKDYNLNGKVKRVSYDSYQSKKTPQGFEKVKKGWEEIEKVDKSIEFNELGKIIEVIYTNSNYKIVRTDKFNYSNQTLAKSFTKYQVIKYTYDNHKRLVTQRVFDRTPASISASNIDEIAGKEKLYVQFKYDLKGKLKQKIKTNKKKNSSSTTSYFYNDNNLLLKEETVYEDGYNDRYVYHYDSNENIINKEWSDNEEGLLEKLTNYYVDNNLSTSVWENYAEGEVEGKIIYKYENGNEVEIIEIDVLENSEIKWEYSYEYDSMNNWTNKIVHTYKNEYYLVERKIEYY